jgi:hypothetical protein
MNRRAFTTPYEHLNRHAFTTQYEHLNRHAFTTQYERLNPARIHHADERLSRHAFTTQYERLNWRAHSPRGLSLFLLPRKATCRFDHLRGWPPWP